MNDWYTNAVIYFTDYSLSFDIWYLLRLCPHLKLYPSSFSFSSIQFFLSSHRLLIPLGTLCIVISSILTYSLCLIYWTIEYKFMQLHFFSIRISQLAFYPDLLQQLFCGWLFYISIYRQCYFFSNSSTRFHLGTLKVVCIFEYVYTELDMIPHRQYPRDIDDKVSANWF